jgi:hypothetical protein
MAEIPATQLPAPVVQRCSATSGDDLPCSACGAPVLPSEPLYTVDVRGLSYGFHAECYRAWVGGALK